MSDYTVDYHLKRVIDPAGAEFALDDRDPRWPEYVAWLASGGTPTIIEAPDPLIVTPLQARIALAHAGLLDAIETAVAALPSTDPTRLAWEYATQFDESSPTLISMCDALGITATQRRQMFVAASQIRV